MPKLPRHYNRWMFQEPRHTIILGSSQSFLQPATKDPKKKSHHKGGPYSMTQQLQLTYMKI